MESKVIRGESAKLSRERRGSFDKKQMSVKVPQSVAELLIELVSLKLQTSEFFVKERGLCGHGLNPKLSSDMACVTPEKIEEVWGKCSMFKTTNTTLSPQSRAELLHLCAKIYGKAEITNNEFMAWVVKGYIAELMGFEVNWASAAASTTLVLVSRLEGELFKRNLTVEEAATLKHLAPYAIPKTSISQSRGSAKCSGLGSHPVEAKLFSGKFKLAGGSIPPVLATEIVQAEEVLVVEGKLLTDTESKEIFLTASKTSIVERIIGFKFRMDDRNVDAKEATENVKGLEEGLKQNGLLISELETNVQQFRDNLDEGNDQFSADLRRLQKLRLEQEAQSKNLEFANFSLEGCQKRAKQVGELYSDACLEMWRVDVDISVVRRELEELRRYKDAVADQIQMMHQGGRVACWPKPCLHSHLPDEGGIVFELEACSFCNRWYTSFDVVMASCRHFYHPFCIAKLVESQNTCVICKKIFHPTWWRSFGFRSQESDVKDAIAKSALARSMEELSDTLKDSFGFPIPECD